MTRRKNVQQVATFFCSLFEYFSSSKWTKKYLQNKKLIWIVLELRNFWCRVLQLKFVIIDFFNNFFSRIKKFQTLYYTCHMSRVTCHMPVTCHMSHVCDDIGGQGILVLGELLWLEVPICLKWKVTPRGQTHKQTKIKTHTNGHYDL